MDDVDEERLLEGDTRNYRKIVVESEDINLEVQSIDNSFMNEVFKLTQENLQIHNNELKEEYSVLNKNEDENKSEKRTNSTCSSRTSHTSSGSTQDNDEEEESSGLESCENSQMSEYSSLSEENVYALIKNFPVQIICLEKDG